MFLVLIALLVFLVIVLIRHLNHNEVNNKTHNWPQPPALPVIGHIHHVLLVLTGRNQFKRSYELLQRYSAEHRMKFWFGKKLYFFNCNPNDMPALFSAPELLAKANDYEVFNNWLGDGLLASKVETWALHRKLLTPAFGYGMLQQFVSIYQKNADKLVNNLRESIQHNEPINFLTYISLSTLDTICETALGAPADGQFEQRVAYLKAIHHVLGILKKRLESVLYGWNFIYKFTKLAKEENAAIKTLHSISESIIEKRRSELLQLESEQKNSPKMLLDEEQYCMRRKLSFLDILLEARIDQMPLSNSNIRDEVNTIIFGGFDTTAITMNFLMYNLSKFKVCQEKCRAEVLEVCGVDKTSKISFEQLKKLNYIEMCLKETLRLYPAGPIIARRAEADCVINDFYIPAGSSVIVSPFYTGRCKDFYPNPGKFIPERFDKNADSKIDPNTFLPFLLGPRGCIGKKYAMLMMKLTVAQLLRNFSFELADEKQSANRLLNFVITLQLKSPLLFKFKEI